MTGDVQKTINRLLDSDFYTVGAIQNRLSESIEALKEKEKVCDIKISDYVESNYQKRRLFYTVNHPSEEVMTELTERIMRKAFGIKRKIHFRMSPDLSYSIQPIYPSIKRGLNLKFHDKYYWCNKQFDWGGSHSKLSISEYIDMYIRVCFNGEDKV